ncbi:P-loop containing nucleoside triphosphate hydrolases superfamily [Salix suchowensis]|nr:P-loop containing nucleoside triphosphate hydrolases superfamily [Salix suchowensis]
MAKRELLLDRWRTIEEEEELHADDGYNPVIRRRLHLLKEQWFADTFKYLISLATEEHIWCGNFDLMAPLLETFYNYYKDDRLDSPLRLLWKRMSGEMQHCIQCVSQHHQAQEMYDKEYEMSSIGPLLEVLRSIDEERVTHHLREINDRLKKQEYDPLRDNVGVVSLMYEVLMFPVILDDQSLLSEFELFIEAVDNMHELALSGHQQFPGVYALLFLNRRVRTVGRRLARSMEKLRGATDLEPLQPLLNKFIGFLETEILPSASKTSRPRAQLERLSIWLGITSLLEFLEPPAFEEGILERYPIFFDIVLNHISGDSAEFSHAVSCLKELFKMLATKHFLYFLLHQVPVSSNFNVLTRKLACKIAILIVHQGYKMNPPCPPFECAHMWAPSLVASLKDSSLHSALRQPAFDLMQIILVSDAAALLSTMWSNHKVIDANINTFLELNDDVKDEDRLPFAIDFEDKDGTCWSEFSSQSKIASEEHRGWMCIPMLWIDVLVDMDSSVLPLSFSKAVFWARSHLTMVEPETSAQTVRTWLSTSATEISTSFGWKVPTGFDDGGGGKESKNSIKVSVMHLPLIRTFNRLTTHFLAQMGLGEFRKQWTWEPSMAESLILSLLDSNDDVRQFGKCILEQVSSTRGLACGLKFLCSSSSSLAAMFLGLKHALKVVQLDSVVSKFQTLQHFFFVLCKLIKEGDLHKTDFPENSSDDSKIRKYSSHGGFLTHPVFDSPSASIDGHSLIVELKLQDKFRYLLSSIAWPTIQMLLVEGKAFIDYSLCQMTCVRVLEILPVVFERLFQPLFKHAWDNGNMVENQSDFGWLYDLMDWGKSSLKVVVVYWKRTVIYLLNLLKGFCSHASELTVRAIEKLISCDNISIDQLTEQVSHLRVALSKEISFDNVLTTSKPKAPDVLPVPIEEDADVQILDSVSVSDKRNKSDVIVVSDDEAGKEISPVKVCFTTDTANKGSKNDTSRDLLDGLQQKDAPDITSLTSQKLDSDKLRGKQPPPRKSKGGSNKKLEIKSKSSKNVPLSSQCRIDQKSSEPVSSKSSNEAGNNMIPETRDSILKELVHEIGADPLEAAVKSVRQQQFNLSKLTATVPKRQVIQLKTPAGNRFGNLQRLEAGVKRFKPPRLDDWYRPILEIDYFAIVGLATARKDEKRTVSRLKEVPVCFQSPEQYVDIFRPLVLEEFKAQLHSSFVEMSSWEEMYYGSLSVLSVERIDDFHLVRFVHDDSDSTSRSLFENDLLLLTKEAPENAAHDVHMVGKVERRERENKRRSSILLIRFYFLNGSLRLNQARRQLVDRSKWHACRIMSITPQLREFQALSSIKDIPILSAILKPINDSLGNNESRELGLGNLSQPLQQTLKSSFNESQLQAISVTIGSPILKKDFDLSLIQGPPGTGKTRTIVAIVSGLLASPQGTRDTKNPLKGHLKQGNGMCITSRPKINQSVAIARAWQDAALARQLNEDVGRNEKSVESSFRRRVLICAQSNAAVDELVSRISSQGLYGNDGKMYRPYLVRVGNAKTVHPNSFPFFIDTLVDNRLAGERMHLSDSKKDSGIGSSAALRSNLEKLVDCIRFYEAKRANLKDGNLDLKNSLEDELHEEDETKQMSDSELEVTLKKLYEEKKQLFKDLSAAQVQEKKTSEEIRAMKLKLRKSILKEAEIVVTTLSGCGGDLYVVCSESMSSYKFACPSEHTLFDAVVIDEAAQALEPATLIPLQLLKSNGTKCIMVGDPKQLPATVLSNVASKFLYECSMFERLQRAGHPVTMLTKQYRMHPEICQFPSLHFYDSKLMNGEQMSNKSASFHEIGVLGPYLFYDITDGQELRGKNSGASSLYNEREAEAAVELLRFFKRRYSSEFVGGRIGIITPYKCQLSLLRSRFSSAFGSSVVADMEFNTVDGFQGREVDILILSTVRAADSSSSVNGLSSSSIGFVADVRRMNVALTRAKLSLWILGNARTLQTNQNWAALVKDAKERNLVISAKQPYESLFETAPRDACKRESINNHSRLSRHAENSRGSGKLGKQNEQKVHRDKNSIRSVTRCHSTVAGDGKDFYIQSSKRKAREEHDLPGKMNVKSVIPGESVTGDESKGKERSEKKLGSGKKKDKCANSKSSREHSEHELGDGYKNLKLSRGTKKSIEGKRSQKNLESSTSSDEGSLKSKEVNDGRDPNPVGACLDMITKRKQQREAVEAILNSSLISSKKSEPSTKSMSSKRPPSPTSVVSGGIRPPKTRKGLR